MYFDNFKLTKITSSTIINPFNCSDDDLNGFLFDDAKGYHENLILK